MALAFDALLSEALSLPPRERLFLASLLLESTEADTLRGAGQQWDQELVERIRAIDSGIEAGIPYEEVRRVVRERLGF